MYWSQHRLGVLSVHLLGAMIFGDSLQLIQLHIPTNSSCMPQLCCCDSHLLGLLACSTYSLKSQRRPLCLPDSFVFCPHSLSEDACWCLQLPRLGALFLQLLCCIWCHQLLEISRFSTIASFPQFSYTVPHQRLHAGAQTLLHNSSLNFLVEAVASLQFLNSTHPQNSIM